MRLNWLAYNYKTVDGYGRYSAYMVRSLRRLGIDVAVNFIGATFAPKWLLDEWRIDKSAPTIICAPPYFLQKKPRDVGPQWLLTMTEGSECPDGWAELINNSGVERVIVPCQHNAEAFRNGGVLAPISVIPGGTDPDEFPLRIEPRTFDKPYTFLALADRGKRKGWSEVYDAFYMAFGGKTTGDMDVRLLVKYRPGGSDLIDMILAKTPPAELDKRIVYFEEDAADMSTVYAQADCFVIPSRSEGFGMPHREAAMTGLPVITQAYSGMDDGHTHEWAIVVEKGRMEPVEATQDGHIKGEWRVCDRSELAEHMALCYEYFDSVAEKGKRAAAWLRANQTWDHACTQLLQVLQQEGVLEREFA